MHELTVPHTQTKTQESTSGDRDHLSLSCSSVEDTILRLFKSRSPKSAFIGRQLIFSQIPSSAFIENYLFDNEGKPQDLTLFPMMKQIYDHLPQKLLLKCSRKTLKSTLLSNIICLNLIRWNHYHMLYVAPQEASTKYFSSNYVGPRFESPEIKKIFVKGWNKNDVYEKIFEDTRSSVLFKYAKEDATRCRGPATDHNIHDEVQDMNFDILPIIKETMALSKYKREFFAGTPLTTDNTINKLWETSTMLEWTTRCGCGHWNMLTIDNDPISMIRPEGFSCSRCSHILDTTQGEWVSSYIPDQKKPKPDLVGYHLAQPILPYFNQIKKEWSEFYKKVTDGKYGVHQIYNEAFGLAYDIGMKPITEKELERLCVLGPIRGSNNDELKILADHRQRYVKYTTGVDWGVNMVTSRTAVVHGAIRDDGIYEVFDAKIFSSLDYRDHIREIAGGSNRVNSICVCDSGPDAFRGHELMDMTSPQRCLLARYGDGKLIQAYDMPKGAQSPKENRYLLHKSDCISFTFRMLKGGKILFPDWTEMKDAMQDILNEFIEVEDKDLGQKLRYRHDPLKPDDFLHALTFAVVAAYTSQNDPLLNGPSSSAGELLPND